MYFPNPPNWIFFTRSPWTQHPVTPMPTLAFFAFSSQTLFRLRFGCSSVHSFTIFRDFPSALKGQCPISLKSQSIKGIGRSRSSFLVGMFLADQVNTKVSYFLLFIIDLLINILNLSLFQAICIDLWERWFDWQLCEFSHCVSNFCKWLGEDWYHLHNYNNYKNTNTTLAIACQADEKEIKLN